jgi:acetyltransferase-like isoleucine patch superfamily enzyme
MIFEAGNLPVKQLPGAVDSRNQKKVLFQTGNWQLLTANSTSYGTLRRVTPAQVGRVTWMIVSLFVVETLVFGLSVLPAFAFWSWSMEWVPNPWILRPAVVAMSLIPAYLVFAFALIALSAFSTKICGWRTAPNGAWKLSDLEWPLLDWSRYMVSTHVVRVLVGTFFRASFLWTLYMRWNGARMGRGVHINSLSISDHNMLDFGDGVVLGENVHLSGHTVEAGMVKTGTVKLGRYVTVGLGSMVGINVEAGEKCQIGAMSVVLKGTRLDAESVYVGVPVRKVERNSPAAATVETALLDA